MTREKHLSQYYGKTGFTLVSFSLTLAVILGSGCPMDTNSKMFVPSNKPTVQPPADQIVECDGSGNQAALDAWLNSATFTEGCGGATLTSDFVALVPDCGAAGAVVVTWTATDDCENSGSAEATFTIEDTTDPTLDVPPPISVTCGEPDATTDLLAWLADASATDTCGDVTITTTRSAAPGNCTATITWTATDECGNSTSAASTYTTVGDTTDPTMALIGGDVTIECGEPWEDPGTTIADDCDALIQPTITGDVDLHTPGIYVLTYMAIDACGNTGPTLMRTVTVEDTTPPEITIKPAIELWPPNHRLVTLTLADLATVEDACEGELDPNEVGTILDIYSDEPENDTGDGNTSGDIVIVNDHTFSVRAERRGGGDGRVYGIRFEVTDASGNTAEATGFVHVHHDQSGSEAVDDGAAAGYLVTP
jgi:surface protein with Ig-like domain